MEEAVSRLSSLALSDRKKVGERHTCTPVLFNREEDINFSGGSLVWQTLGFIWNMITHRILDSILLQTDTNPLYGSPKATLSFHSPKTTRGHAKQRSDQGPRSTDFLNPQEAELLLSNRKSIERHGDHIANQICHVNDLQRELMFTRTDLILLSMRERNAQLIEVILSDEAIMQSLHRLQSAFEVYEKTLEPPAEFHCDIAEHSGKECECYKDFDDYGDFACVAECLDGILDSFSGNDQSSLAEIAAVSIFYLRLAPHLDGDSMLDYARELFDEGKDFLLSIWDNFVTKHSAKMAPVELFYMFFMLESLNLLEGCKGFQNCIKTVKKCMEEKKVDVYTMEELLVRSERRQPRKSDGQLSPKPESPSIKQVA